MSLEEELCLLAYYAGTSVNIILRFDLGVIHNQCR